MNWLAEDLIKKDDVGLIFPVKHFLNVHVNMA